MNCLKPARALLGFALLCCSDWVHSACPTLNGLSWTPITINEGDDIVFVLVDYHAAFSNAWFKRAVRMSS